MTLLVAWIGIDSRVPASAYIASDSRISWPGPLTWDGATKTFASTRLPDIFGYAGHVQFPSLILGQFVAAVDSGAFLADDTPIHDRRRHLRAWLERGLETYPASQAAAFKVLHIGRENSGQASRFDVATLDWKPGQGQVAVSVIPSPLSSAVLRFGRRVGRPVVPVGSGRTDFEADLGDWTNTPAGSTSRSVFWSVCRTIHAANRLDVGGPPQLVGLRKTGGGKCFVVFSRGRPALGGTFLPDGYPPPDGAECFNELFERVDGRGVRLSGAAAHSYPPLLDF
jgi:hypothetical protein